MRAKQPGIGERRASHGKGSLRPVLALGLVLFWAPSTGLADDAAKEPSAFSDQLRALAARCDELALAEQAAITRRWIVPRHPGRQYLFVDDHADDSDPPSSAPTVVKQWHDRLLAIRRAEAERLFAAAKEAVHEQPTRAYQLLFEVIHYDPGHAEARRALGYTKDSRGQWKLPDAEKLTAETSRTDYPRLGWRAGSYFRMETPHFQIVTNHSKRELLEAGEQLEKLATLWRQLFFRYWSSGEALAARLAGGREPLARPRPKMQVVLFKDQGQYARHVAPLHPKAAETLGIYADKQRTAYFFAGDTSVYPVWYHEGTHQLFQEAVERTRDEPGAQRDFWAAEGAALYMESLVDHAGYWTAGGWESESLQFARNRVLSGEFAVPLERLAALGREAVQNSDDIRRLYTEAAGFTHFFLDGEKGRYRDAFIDLLAALYRGEATERLLVQRTGQSSATLDQQYRAFLNVTDHDLAALAEPAAVRSLLLGRTSVTDKGLAQLAGCKSLERLDLSLTAASDAGLQSLAGATKLKQLYLAGSKVTEASLPAIARCKELEDLDLAALPIGDEGLALLAGLRKLKELRLAGTRISDAGLMHLRGLKQLEVLDTEGTVVTQQGRQRLEKALPKLQPAP